MAKGKRNQQISLAGFIICTICITALLPRRTSPSFEYEQGRIWQHADLVAPVNFPILKTNAELQQEIQAAEQRKKLYFRFNPNALQQSIQNLEENIQRETRWSEKVKKRKHKPRCQHSNKNIQAITDITAIHYTGN